jgi:DNA (cytosine-5)-methyltransferase 1
MTRFNTVFANDIRPDARAAWSRYFKRPEMFHLGSVVGLAENWENDPSQLFPGKVDIVTGGFPCQDFSVAGKRKGFSSDKSHDGKFITPDLGDDVSQNIENRGQLYKWMRKIICMTCPKLFIAENVKGMVSLADAKKIIEQDFRSICDGGYLVVESRVLHAADYGVPQSRERVIFYGFRKSELKPKAYKALSQEKIDPKYDPYPPQTHAYTNSNDLFLPPTTAREAFVGLPEPELATDLSQQKYSKAKYMGKHCQGQSEVNLSGIGPTIRAEHHGNIEYRRLSREHGGKYHDELAAGLRERRLTVRECARLQTFPDEYQFVGPGVSASDAYKIIGNAVPPLLAYNIAKQIERNWKLYFKKDN